MLVIKSAPESRTQISFSADSELTIGVAAVGTYTLECLLSFSDGDVRYGVNTSGGFAAGAILPALRYKEDETTALTLNVAPSSTSVSGGGDSAGYICGSFTVSTVGDVYINWRSNGGSTATINAGSWLRITSAEDS